MDVGGLDLGESLVAFSRGQDAIRRAAEMRHELGTALSADDVVDELMARARTPEPPMLRLRTFVAARIRGMSL